MNAVTLLTQLLSGPITTQGREEEILRLFEGADSAQLNDMLSDRDLVDRLFDRVDDRIFGADNFTALLDLLTAQRRADLDLTARANVIFGLQTGRTDARDEQRIADLFCDVTGDDLTDLKNLIDATHSQFDLEALVYSDIDDEAIRSRILRHIECEATTPATEPKVLSDIDDTVICSLKDRSFPRGVVYPGVLELWEALDQGPSGHAKTIGDLAFVTARPGIFGVIENYTRDSLARSGVKKSPFLSGSLIHVLSHDKMAERKVENILHYHSLFPEYRIVVIGDSGQGDVTVCQTLNRDHPGVAVLTMIHDVVDTPRAEREAYARQQVFFFDTYARAAGYVLEHDLISPERFTAVIDATVRGFDEVEWSDDEQEKAARARLDADLEAIRALVP